MERPKPPRPEALLGHEAPPVTQYLVLTVTHRDKSSPLSHVLFDWFLGPPGPLVVAL